MQTWTKRGIRIQLQDALLILESGAGCLIRFSVPLHLNPLLESTAISIAGVGHRRSRWRIDRFDAVLTIQLNPFYPSLRIFLVTELTQIKQDG